MFNLMPGDMGVLTEIRVEWREEKLLSAVEALQD